MPLAKLALAALLTVAVAVGLGACGGGDEKSTAADPSAPTVDVKLTDAGCEPATLQLPAGKRTFRVTNAGAPGVTEFEILDGGHIIGEVENVAPGLTKQFTMTLKTGSFTLKCPGGKTASAGTLDVAESR